jgi:hypothetical protein
VSTFLTSSHCKLRPNTEGHRPLSHRRLGGTVANHELCRTPLNELKVTVHSVITDLVGLTTSKTEAVTVSAINGANGIFRITASHRDLGKPWSAFFFSDKLGPPSANEATLSPLPGAQGNLWGSRYTPPPPQPPSPPPPPPPRPPPPPPCPTSGCGGCGGCKWPYVNSTEPNPSRPFTTSSDNATTLECETTCAAAHPACVGFTRRSTSARETALHSAQTSTGSMPNQEAHEDDGGLGVCWYYSHVSGQFKHTPGSSVSWHPNPA